MSKRKFLRGFHGPGKKKLQNSRDFPGIPGINLPSDITMGNVKRFKGSVHDSYRDVCLVLLSPNIKQPIRRAAMKFSPKRRITSGEYRGKEYCVMVSNKEITLTLSFSKNTAVA